MIQLTRREFLQRAAILGLSATTVAMLDGCGILPTPTPAKIPRIGMLVPATQVATVELVQTFQQGLRDLGYIEGKNIVVEYRYADSQDDRFTAIASEFIALNVDIMVTGPGRGIAALKNATSTIPIVFIGVVDPVGTHLVASFAHPGGNATGLTSGSEIVTGKRLELLKESIPGISRVIVASDSGVGTSSTLPQTQEAAKGLGLTLELLDGTRLEEIESAFASAMSRHPEALFSLIGFSATGTRVAELATKNRLPSSFPLRSQVIEGGLMSYATNNLDYWYRAAAYVDRIIKGSKPADLPVEQPTKYDFVINLKTAKAIELTIPQSILARATEVIQ